MQIYPQLQAQMLLAAFSLGLGAGLFRQILLALRTVLGAYLPPERMRTYYERSLPLLHRAPGFPRKTAKRAWCFLIAFFGDVFFCLAVAFTWLLLLYHYEENPTSLFLCFLSAKDEKN